MFVQYSSIKKKLYQLLNLYYRYLLLTPLLLLVQLIGSRSLRLWQFFCLFFFFLRPQVNQLPPDVALSTCQHCSSFCLFANCFSSLQVTLPNTLLKKQSLWEIMPWSSLPVDSPTSAPLWSHDGGSIPVPVTVPLHVLCILSSCTYSGTHQTPLLYKISMFSTYHSGISHLF